MAEKMVFQIHDIELIEILDKKLQRRQDWCAVAFLAAGSIPCVSFAAEFEIFAQQTKAVYCAEISVDENPNITAKCGVLAVPTTLILHAGVEKARYEGPYSARALLERVSELLKA